LLPNTPISGTCKDAKAWIVRACVTSAGVDHTLDRGSVEQRDDALDVSAAYCGYR